MPWNDRCAPPGLSSWSCLLAGHKVKCLEILARIASVIYTGVSVALELNKKTVFGEGCLGEE